MRDVIRILFAAGMVLLGAAIAPALGQAKGPAITHEPVTVAARGQAISILARVRIGDAPIKMVTLYYTPSRDASPIAQPMTPTGGEVYVGTIPNTYLATAPSVHYYLEAVDMNDEWAETQWSQIQIRDAVPADGSAISEHAPATTATPAAAPVVAGSRTRAEGGGLSTGAMIGGGVLAAGAAVAIIAATGSGGGGGSGNGNTNTGGGGDTNTVVECTADDAIGTWTGTTSAPGFILGVDGSAQFFATINGVPDEGSYGLVDCTLTLIPSSTTNTVYRGSGELSSDKTAVSINGITFTKL